MSARTAHVLLLLVLALAAAERLRGIRFGVPLSPEPDTFVVEHVANLRRGPDDLDPRFSDAQYPSLLADVALRLPGPVDDPEALARMQLDEHLRNAAQPYVQVRAIVMAIGLLVVPATYLVARAFLGRGWSVLAAAFAAGSLLLVNLGQNARPHAALAALMTLAIAAALRLRRAPTAPNHLLAGAIAALALGVLHTGALALLPLLATLALARPAAHRAGLAALALLPVPAAGLWFYRWIYAPTGVQAQSIGEALPDHEPITFGWWIEELLRFADTAAAPRVARIALDWEPVLVALAAAAALLALLGLLRGERPRGELRADLLVVAAFALPYGLLLSIFGKTYERFLTPLIPLCACAAAWLGARAWERWPAARQGVIAASLAALCASSAAGAKLSWLRGRPDTLSEASARVRELARPLEAIRLLPPVDLALARTAERLQSRGDGIPQQFSPWARYQAELPAGGIRGEQFDVAWLGEHPGMGDLDQDGPLSAFLDAYGPGLYVIDVERLRKHRWYGRIRGRIAQTGRLLARLSPDRDPHATDLGLRVQDSAWDDRPAAAWRILRARAIGPVLEIWRVGP